MRQALARWRARSGYLGDQWRTWRGEWEAERALERVVAGDGPILVGPWRSEVGYEILYWIPFLRWVMAAYRIDPARVAACTRGGGAVWYQGIASRSVELFDLVEPSALAERARAGELKQKAESDFDRELADRAAASLGLRGARVLHPSLMFSWFAPFWSGHETMSYVERHTRYTRVDGGSASMPWPLPTEYVAVKLYSARSLPAVPAVRQQLRALVARLGERWPVVQLDTGLGLDEHADYGFDPGGRVLSVSGRLEPRTNLAVQTRIIAGARMFVGTCGSLAWLAPMLGVPTLALLTDDSFLHAHLHLARRMYARTGAARFSALDLGGLLDAGLDISTGRGDTESRSVRISVSS